MCEIYHKEKLQAEKYRFSGKARLFNEIRYLCFVVNITHHNATLKYALTWKAA